MKHFIRVCCCLLLLVSLVSCGIFRKQDAAEKQMKKNEKLQRKKAKEADKMYRKAIKKHMKIQQKSVRKKMKKSYGRSGRVNDNRREFFLVRWFKGGIKTKRSSGK